MISYDELLQKYKLLEQENKNLKAQIAELQKEKNDPVKISENATYDFPNSQVTMQSTPSEKIRLFRDFFRGREDVFARRWYSTTTPKSGYQPVCGSEWESGLCDKRKYKCSECPNRKLLPLTDNDIFKHLAGKDAYARDVIGKYPMLTDETRYFLCADFDEEKYEADVTAFREICGEYGVPIAVERSRSGNGAHVWIFFEEPISAADARKIGSGLLSKAMEKRSELTFKSYDRFLPNQDTMPKGGFGNLIALPLQGLARKNGNSVFVNESFCPYSDQWAFLSSVKKLEKEMAESLAGEFSKSGELGALIADNEETKPWQTKTKEIVISDDFPETVNVVKANMLYVPTSGFSPAAKNQIKRLAAFKNPDFYRAQKMRLPVYNKPRIICTADISDEYIAIPRGCEEALGSLFEPHSVQYSIEDKTNHGTKINVKFNGTLREEQQLAADTLLENNLGVLSATTAFGKTVIAAYLIANQGVNTLVLVHTAALMEQWKSSLERFLILYPTPTETEKHRGRKKPWSPIGQLGSGKNTLHETVDIAVMQSLISDDEVKELVRNYGMIIVDECHHVPAVNFEKILSYANAQYVYGLTATPTRQDGHQPIIFMQCGPVRYRVDAKEQAEKRDFDHFLIPRFTAFRSASANDKRITDLYLELAENAPPQQYNNTRCCKCGKNRQESYYSDRTTGTCYAVGRFGLHWIPECYISDGEADTSALGEGAYMSISAAIDNTAPVVEDVKYDPESGEIIVSAKDNRYVAGTVLYNRAGTYAYDSTGSKESIDMNKTAEYALSTEGLKGTKFLIQVVDYANNVITVECEENIGADIPVPDVMTFRSDPMSGGNNWVSVDQGEYGIELSNYMRSDYIFEAAAAAEHYIFAYANDKALYVMPEDDLDNISKVADIPYDALDLAYNPTDEQLYALIAYEGKDDSDVRLVTIDILTGEIETVGIMPSLNITLACDDEGTFYTAPTATFIDDWVPMREKNWL